MIRLIDRHVGPLARIVRPMRLPTDATPALRKQLAGSSNARDICEAAEAHVVMGRVGSLGAAFLSDLGRATATIEGAAGGVEGQRRRRRSNVDGGVPALPWARVVAEDARAGAIVRMKVRLAEKPRTGCASTHLENRRAA